MKYLLDSNILITAYRVTNPMDIYPSFWDKLSDVVQLANVISIDKVRNEIAYFEDDLKKWCDVNISSDFWCNCEMSMNYYGKILNWAHQNNYKESAFSKFAEADNADAFLVSYALYLKKELKEDITVVSLEVRAPYGKKNIKLPDVCDAFGISYCDNNDLYRALNISF